MRRIKSLVLAGGMGKRLWPMSRENWPKYMLRLGMEKSLLQMAYERLNLNKEDRYIVGAASAGFLISNEIKEIDGYFPDENLILEPLSRNTAPAIMLGIKDMDDDDIVAVLPADQLVEGDFEGAVLKAAAIAEEGYIVTIGITPDSPATGYGYIKKSSETLKDGFRVEEFREKPDEKTAEEYCRSGEYFWNAGIFVFRVGSMREEMKKHAPDVSAGFDMISEAGLKAAYEKLPDISIDYAVMEKTGRAAVLPYTGKWSDLGSWESVSGVLAGDGGVFVNGEAYLKEVKDSVIYTDKGKLVAGIGLDGLIAVDTGDALLLLKKGEGQKVKDVVDRLKGDSRIKHHATDFRPWGNYAVIAQGEGYKIKILNINPASRLSLQRHRHRDEVWTVISGAGIITVDGSVLELKAGETASIPSGAVHRAENRGAEELKILELASGSKISEEDIERLEDDYDRV